MHHHEQSPFGRHISWNSFFQPWCHGGQANQSWVVPPNYHSTRMFLTLFDHCLCSPWMCVTYDSTHIYWTKVRCFNIWIWCIDVETNISRRHDYIFCMISIYIYIHNIYIQYIYMYQHVVAEKLTALRGGAVKLAHLLVMYRMIFTPTELWEKSVKLNENHHVQVQPLWNFRSKGCLRTTLRWKIWSFVHTPGLWWVCLNSSCFTMNWGLATSWPFLPRWYLLMDMKPGEQQLW